MATKITKWTKERERRKDFVDPTRRGHQPFTYHLSGHDVYQLRELAKYDETRNEKYEPEKIEGKEAAVVRKRIDKLRAQLHNVTLVENDKAKHELDSERETPPKSVKDLKHEARMRKDLLRTARSYIPPKPQPVTPKQRGQRIHTKVLSERAIQVKEKQERIRAKKAEDAKWAKRVVQNHEKFQEDAWRENLERLERRERLKKDLDDLCVERTERLNTIRDDLIRTRKDIEIANQLYDEHQQHWQLEDRKAKVKNREKALKEIMDIKDMKLQEAIRDEKLKEEDLRYSAFKRAYGRRVKQRILDKMLGKRPTVQV